MNSSIEPAEMKKRLDKKENVFLLDVRQPEEFSRWKMEGSVNIPLGELGERIKELPKDREIVAICLHGMRSMRASQFLRGLGFNAKTMEGGMVEWNSVIDVCRIEEGIIQFRRVGKGCLSYMLISGKEAVIVDPVMEVGEYFIEAKKAGVKITAILDTHIHADHLSGGNEISKISGAKYYLPGDSKLRHEGLPAGMEIRFGNETIKAIGTPGHTPESMTFLFRGFAFTGDTLFVDGFGRTDLGIDPKANAPKLWDSVNNILYSLPEETKILPAHSSKPILPMVPVMDAIGNLKKRLTIGREEFSTMASANRDTPGNFDIIKRINLGLDECYPEEVKELEAGPNRCSIEIK